MKDLSDVHDGQVTSVEFSKDGTLVATASRDNTVKVTDMRTYRVLHELQGSSRGKPCHAMPCCTMPCHAMRSLLPFGTGTSSALLDLLENHP